MGNATYIVTGTVVDANTVRLDESLPIQPTKVRITIESLDEPDARNRYLETMAELRQRQKARNHHPSTAAEVDEYLRQERDSWE